MRIAICDPPAAKSERASGLIVPAHIVDGDLSIGIVLFIPSLGNEEREMMIRFNDCATFTLSTGMLVYYRSGTEFKIGDTKIIDVHQIVAYEEA
jgi:hypothetical protein